MKFSVLVLLLATVVTVGCQKKDANDSVIAESELKPFLGKWVSCKNFANGAYGSDFRNGSSRRIEVTISSNGAFTVNKWWHDGALNCLGGDNVISFSQHGTVDVQGVSTYVTNGINIDFHSTDSVVTVRTLTGADFHAHWNAAYLNAQLQDTTPGVIGMAIDKTSARGGSANIVFDDLYGPTYTSYNTATFSGSTMTISDPFDWDMGNGGYPLTVGEVYTKQ